MIYRLTAAVIMVLSLSAFQVVDGVVPKPDQPSGERQAQNKLPQSKSPLWTKLAQCRVSLDSRQGTYSITVTDEVKSLAGQTINANGFILPMDGNEKTKHFLLAKRTPVCMFCPPGEPNEVIEVKSKTPMEWVDDAITVRGRFSLVNDGEKGIFFLIDGAELLQGKDGSVP